MKALALFVVTVAAALGSPAQAEPSFAGALVIEGTRLDASGGTIVNDGRLGFFSDLYYDPQRDEWWALSDRGPGGGTLHYETRVQQFKVDVDPTSGAISNFQILKTLIFRKGGSSLDGFAPDVGGPLGVAFDPEGLVIHPLTGHLLVSDEYGPSLLEINRTGQVVRRYEIPANLLPRNAATGVVNYASDDGNTAGKRPTADSRDLPSVLTAAPCMRCCKVRCSTKAPAMASSTASWHSTRVPAPDRPVRLSHGRQFAGARISALVRSTITSSLCSSATIAVSGSTARSAASQPIGTRRFSAST